MSTILRIPRALVNRIVTPGKKLPRTPDFSDQKKSKWYNFKKFAFNVSEYNRYGLYTDDVWNYDSPIIKEALRRLPKDVRDSRNFRLIRALQLDFLRIYLPKEKWITYEQDLEYRYLEPYTREIMAERMEIYEFGCVNYGWDDWPAHVIV